LLAHPKFIAGDFNTGFIAEHFPAGFHAQLAQHDDPDFLVALAAAVQRRLLARAAGISGQVPGHGFQIGEDYVVVVRGERGAATQRRVHVQSNGSICVTVDGKRYEFTGEWSFGRIRITGLCNGEPFTAQVERARLNLSVSHNGARIDAMVLTPRAAELARLMPYKAPPDTSKYLLSPMPGLLAEIAVQAGQQVVTGERLAVVEAMKMENVLTASQDATVAEILAPKGESLSVDQPILRFE
jgi:propionyl-CoA carboxylase alpha chain